jgi:carbamoylphosphate synthase large subunit
LPLPYAKFSLFRLGTRTANDGRTVGHAIADSDAVTFRGPDVADLGASPLVLRLSDFFPRSTRDSNLAAHTIEFSHQELADMLAVAEAAQAEIDNPGTVASPDPCELPDLDAVEFTHKRKVDEVLRQ